MATALTRLRQLKIQGRIESFVSLGVTTYILRSHSDIWGQLATVALCGTRAVPLFGSRALQASFSHCFSARASGVPQAQVPPWRKHCSLCRPGASDLRPSYVGLSPFQIPSGDTCLRNTLHKQQSLPLRPIIPLVARISDQNASGAPPMTVREKTRLEKFRQLLSSHNTDLGACPRALGRVGTGDWFSEVGHIHRLPSFACPSPVPEQRCTEFSQKPVVGH